MFDGRRPTGVNALLTAAALVIVVAGLDAAEQLLVPLLFAAFLAQLTAPIVLWARDRGVPVVLSVTVVTLGVSAALALFAGVIGSSLTSFALGWPKYAARLDASLTETLRWLDTHGIAVERAAIDRLVHPDRTATWLSDTLTTLANTVGNVLVVVLLLVFMLLEVVGIGDKLRLALGDPDADLGPFGRIALEVKRYLVLKTYISLAVGVTVWLLLVLLGVDFAFLWAVVAFLLNYIPNVGAVLSAVPPMLLAAVQYDVGVALMVAGGYTGIHLVIGNLIEPYVQGRAFGMSVFVVVLSLVFWGWLWGPAGMLLSLPLTMVIKIALEQSEEWRWLAILMDPPPKPRRRTSLPPPSVPPPSGRATVG